MSKFILIAMIFTQAVVFAQTSKTFTSDCGLELTIASKVGQPNASEFAVIEFSIANLSPLKSSTKVFLEIQPLTDCFNGENGEKFGNIIRVEVTDNVKQANEVRTAFNLVQRKCFNWRVVVSSQNTSSETSTSQTNWKYSPFVF